MDNILQQIVASKKDEVLRARAAVPLEEMRRRAAAVDRPRNLYAAILAEPRYGIHLIAEIKKASPSAGLIRADFDPAAIAATYHSCGAAALSVLTDEPYFQGSLEHIALVKAAVPLPVLRKDFVIDEYQIYESRAAGADAILLIGELLEPAQLMDMLILANELKLTSLVEMHDVETVMRYRSLIGFPLRGYSLLGINNRDLKTQTIDLGNTARMISMLDEEMPVVAESGIRTRADVQRMRRSGARAVLIGETFMRAPDIAAAVRELLGPG